MRPTPAQKRALRSAARLYAVQALFQMEAAGAPQDRVAREFGLVFRVGDDVREKYRAYGVDLARSNGDDSWELPVPATYVVAPDRTITYAFVEADYTRRAAPADVVAALTAAGHEVEVLSVPGALEIPGAIALAAESGRYDGFVAIGVVIRGETYHFEIVAGESARGLMALTMDGLAVGNGILTVENEQQAIVRANPKHANKGGGAAEAALALLGLQSSLRA